jgi:hypothetical protein
MLLPQNNRLKLMRVTIKDLIGSLNPFLVLLVMITPFWLWFPKQLFPVMAKSRAVRLDNYTFSSFWAISGNQYSFPFKI